MKPLQFLLLFIQAKAKMVLDNVRGKFDVVCSLAQAPPDQRPPFPKLTIATRPVDVLKRSELAGPRTREAFYQGGTGDREGL